VTPARRIVPRIELFPAMHRAPASADARARGRQCRATIRLDGTEYRCEREIVGTRGGFHEGIHDAFVEHGDGGAVRW
jgi:hypothetical protein